MSKTITSPIARWQGTVTLAEPLTLPQAEAIEQAQDALSEKIKELIEKNTEHYFSELDKLKTGAINMCIEKWSLDNFTPLSDNTVPYSPRKDSHHLIDWLFSELVKIYSGESEVPNE